MNLTRLVVLFVLDVLAISLGQEQAELETPFPRPLTACGVIVTGLPRIEDSSCYKEGYVTETDVWTNTSQIVLTKNLTHHSLGGRAGGSCIILCDGASLDGRGFSINGCVDCEDYSKGLAIFGSKVSVRNVHFFGFDWSIFVKNGSDVFIESVTAPPSVYATSFQIDWFSRNVVLFKVTAGQIIISDAFGVAINDSALVGLAIDNSTVFVDRTSLGSSQVQENSSVSLSRSMIHGGMLEVMDSSVGLASTTICGNDYKDIFIANVDHSLVSIFSLDGNVTCGTSEPYLRSDFLCDKPCPNDGAFLEH
jgi:hypothetical protein